MLGYFIFKKPLRLETEPTKLVLFSAMILLVLALNRNVDLLFLFFKLLITIIYNKTNITTIITSFLNAFKLRQ